MFRVWVHPTGPSAAAPSRLKRVSLLKIVCTEPVSPEMVTWFRVWCLAFGVWRVAFGFWGVGCGVWGVGCGVWGVGCGVWGLGAQVSGFRFRLRDAGFGVTIGEHAAKKGTFE